MNTLLRYCLLLFSISAPLLTIAQIVDIESTSEGLIPPRVPVASSLTCNSTNEGAIVYQTNAPEGLYTCDGSSWQAVGGSSSSGLQFANKEITSTMTISASGSNESLGYSVPAPEDGTYLVQANFQCVRSSSFIGPLVFELTVNGSVETSATRTVSYTSGFNEPVGMMKVLSLNQGDIVDIRVSNPSAATGEIQSRNMVLIKLADL